MDKVSSLVCQIVLAKRAYYTGKPLMSDSAYDALEISLRKKDPNHPILYAVGYDTSYDWWLEHYDYCEKSSIGEHHYIPGVDSFENPYCKFCFKGS